MVIDDDLERARRVVREHLALYIGGMGARTKNFYNDYTKRLGYEAAAVEVQDHFLAGRRAEAAAAVPDPLIDDVALVGPADRIRRPPSALEGGGRPPPRRVASRPPHHGGGGPPPRRGDPLRAGGDGMDGRAFDVGEAARLPAEEVL